VFAVFRGVLFRSADLQGVWISCLDWLCTCNNRPGTVMYSICGLGITNSDSFLQRELVKPASAQALSCLHIMHARLLASRA
jgi:hypothetical protein